MSIAASEGEPELLERKIRLRCRSGGSNAWVGSGSDGYAFPGHRKGRARVEKATVSRTLEVGRLVSRGSLCWFSAPCPGCLSPGRAWGAYRSWTAPFTARNRPANSSSLTTLGGAARGYGGPPGGAVSCDASVSLYCLHPAGDQQQLDAIITCQCALARLVYTQSGLVSLSDIPIRRSSDVTSPFPPSGNEGYIRNRDVKNNKTRNFKMI